jgi:hypothetical protein
MSTALKYEQGSNAETASSEIARLKRVMAMLENASRNVASDAGASVAVDAAELMAELQMRLDELEENAQ